VIYTAVEGDISNRQENEIRYKSIRL